MKTQPKKHPSLAKKKQGARDGKGGAPGGESTSERVFSLTEYRAKGDASWAAQVFSETSGRQYYFPNKRIEGF